MARIPFELIAWVIGLAIVALIPPADFSICIFHHLGFRYCPGCGLGHAIYYLIHGQWQASLDANPLALFAIIILTLRIKLLFNQYQLQQINTTK